MYYNNEIKIYQNQLTIRQLAKELEMKETTLRSRLLHLNIIEKISRQYLLTDQAQKMGFGQVKKKAGHYDMVHSFNLFHVSKIKTRLQSNQPIPIVLKPRSSWTVGDPDPPF
ncbi:MAG: phage antirepressor KilAC domain-containing protein [Cyclobacteriaceae bacterium]|nr:phage antirepressor KilAC domain-containing protein [Cyclobacteriaceae bacterium]